MTTRIAVATAVATMLIGRASEAQNVDDKDFLVAMGF
jgi:hypothetical protein